MNTFARFKSAYRLELRQSVGNLFYVLLHVLWLLLMFSMMVSTDVTVGSLMEIAVGRTAVGLLTLAALFAAGLSATRSTRNRFDVLEASYPTGGEILLARWLGSFTALLPFLIAPLVTAASLGDFPGLLAHAGIFLTEGVVMLAFASALSFLISHLFGTHAWVFSVLALLWVAFSFIPSFASVSFPGAALFNFSRLVPVNYTDLWGRWLWGIRPSLFNGFYAALTVVLLALLLWQIERRRFYRGATAWTGLVAASLLLAVFAGASYLTVSASAEPVDPLWELANDDNPVTVRSYALQIDLQQPEQPVFNAHLNVTNDGGTPLDQITLYLDPTFTLMHSDMTAVRDGDAVILTSPFVVQPGETVAVNLTYSGTIWHLVHDQSWVFARDFAGHEGLRLSPALLWYPRAGHGLPEQPFAAQLEIYGSESMKLATNLPTRSVNAWSADAAYSMYVVGAPDLVTEQIGSFMLVGHSRGIETLRPFVSTYFENTLNAVQSFFPDINQPNVVLFVDDVDLGQPLFRLRADDLIESQLTSGLDWDFAVNNLIQASPFADDLVTSLFGANAGQFNWGLTNFLWVYSLSAGDLTILMALTADDPFMDVFVNVYMSQGSEGIQRLIERARERADELQTFSTEELIVTLREMSNAR